MNVQSFFRHSTQKAINFNISEGKKESKNEEYPMHMAVGGQLRGNNFYFSDMNGSSATKYLASNVNEDKYH